MSGISISKIEYYLPEFCLSNNDLSLKFGTDATEIFKKTGIHKRFHTSSTFLMSDMAATACQKIFNSNSEIKDKINNNYKHDRFVYQCSLCKIDYNIVLHIESGIDNLEIESKECEHIKLIKNEKQYKSLLYYIQIEKRLILTKSELYTRFPNCKFKEVKEL